jgi:hypothetical protein
MVERQIPKPKNIEILGAEDRKQTRPRGFVDWQPRAETQVVLDQVQQVLQEYDAYLPLTIRQIFYRLVGNYEYEKTEKAYNKLCEIMNRARRARIIPMSAIRDDGITEIKPNSWLSADHFLRVVSRQASVLRLDRTKYQKVRLVVMCEASGMAPQLAQVADPYGIKVLSSGGFNSVTDQYNIARDVIEQDRPTEVLHIGDHDPSGVHVFIALEENVSKFARELLNVSGMVRFTRVAVTPDQIDQYALPTAPPKATDGRAFDGDTCQAEAFAPDQLANILRDAIEQRLDRDVYESVLGQEQQVRQELLGRLGREDDV